MAWSNCRPEGERCHESRATAYALSPESLPWNMGQERLASVSSASTLVKAVAGGGTATSSGRQPLLSETSWSGTDHGKGRAWS